LPEGTNLDHVFTVRNYRQIGSGQTISYGGKVYTFANQSAFSFRMRTIVEVRETMEGVDPQITSSALHKYVMLASPAGQMTTFGQFLK
jgi:vancomycin resistance protein YoaR